MLNLQFDVIYYSILILFLCLVTVFILFIRANALRTEYKDRYFSIMKSYENMRYNYGEIIKAQEKVEQIRSQFNVHLVNDIENVQGNRSYVASINRLMKKSKSLYKLQIRYRHPIKGGYSKSGDSSKTNSKHFSVYLRRR